MIGQSTICLLGCGNWNNGTNTGPWNRNLNNTSGNANNNIGARFDSILSSGSNLRFGIQGLIVRAYRSK